VNRWEKRRDEVRGVEGGCGKIGPINAISRGGGNPQDKVRWSKESEV